MTLITTFITSQFRTKGCTDYNFCAVFTGINTAQNPKFVQELTERNWLLTIFRIQKGPTFHAVNIIGEGPVPARPLVTPLNTGISYFFTTVLSPHQNGADSWFQRIILVVSTEETTRKSRSNSNKAYSPLIIPFILLRTIPTENIPRMKRSL